MIKKIYAAAKLLLLVILILSGEAIPQIEKITDVHNVNSTLNQKQSLEKINSVEKESYEELPIIKPDFMINSVDGDYGARQFNSDIAIDSSGNYAVAWFDTRNGKYEIYAQFYNNKDEKVGVNFRVNETEISDYRHLSVTANKHGDFIFAWSQNGYEIIGQKLTKDGAKNGFNFKISTIYNYLNDISIILNEDGSFLAAWKTYDGIYIRVFDQNGVASDQEKPINQTNSYNNDRSNKYIAVDGNGNYVIVWSSFTGTISYSKIYLQKIDKEGQLIDGNILVTKPENNFNNVFPSIAATDDGHFLIVWGIDENYPSPKKTAGRIYHSSGIFITEPTQFYDTESWSDLITVTSDRKNTFILMYRGENFYCRKITSALEVSPDKILDLNQPVMENSIGNISKIISDHFFISVTSNLNTDSDIYIHKININPYASVSFNKLNDDQGSSWQQGALTYFNDQGNAIVLWKDRRNGRSDLYAQVYNTDFQPVGENFLVNDITSEVRYLDKKTVSSLSDGTFVIAFSATTEVFNPIIFLQPVDQHGNKIGKNKPVKEYNLFIYNLTININDKDEILLCWYSDMDSFLRKFNKDLVPVSPEINFMKYSIYNTFISIDEHLNLFASWVPSTGNSKIFSLIFDQTGRAVSDTIIIDVSDGGYPYYLVNSIDGTNNLFVAWKNSIGVSLLRTYKDGNEYTSKNILNSNAFRSFPKIICFKNRKGLVAWNTTENINGYYFNDNRRETAQYELQQFENPYEVPIEDIYSISLHEDKLFTAFESARNGGTGYDIWANVKRLSNVNFKKEAFFPPVNDDFIYTNFPNPFNSSTTIVYELLSFHKVNLSVYDVLGREVKTLVDEYQEKGLYEIKFDASDLPSGVYFYKLDSFRTIIKKMILIK